MSVPAAQHTGTAVDRQISIKVTKACAARAVLPSPLDMHQGCVKCLGRNGEGFALYAFCFSCCRPFAGQDATVNERFLTF